MNTQPAVPQSPPAPWLRQAVRDVLQKAEGYSGLSPPERRALANAMVRVSAAAASLVEQENHAQGELDRRAAPLARAQDSPGFGASADKIASTTRNVLNAVSFPRFVTDLINGIFKSMIDSSAQQMQLFVQLLNSVSASLDGFSDTQFSLEQIMHWLVDHFPDSLEIEEPERDPEDTSPPDPENVQPPRLRLRANASMPSEQAIRMTLGMAPEELLDASSPESLVPLARRQIARQRQQMLATMVMLGMQRIVVDSGRITAAMRFHIDTRSAAAQESGNTFNFQNRVKASGSFGFGPWGASAEIENTIGYVSTQRSQSSEEMNTDLDLNSSVEINFRSDYLPLNRMTSSASADRIRANSLNPEGEAALASKERSQREASQRQADQDRMRSLDTALAPPSSVVSVAAKPPLGAGTPSVSAPAGNAKPTPASSAPGAANSPKTAGGARPT